MKITLIAAIDQNNGIGKNGTLAWHVPEDMSHFLRTTKGHIVVMGRKTFDSLRAPLKGRENWVLSRTMPATEGVTVIRNISQVLELFEYLAAHPIPSKAITNFFVIGGAEIYEQFADYADAMIITRIAGDWGCDVFFPDVWNRFKLVGMVDLSYEAKVCYYEKK